MLQLPSLRLLWLKEYCFYTLGISQYLVIVLFSFFFFLTWSSLGSVFVPRFVLKWLTCPLGIVTFFSKIQSMIKLSLASWRMQTCFSDLYLYKVVKLNIFSLRMLGWTLLTRRTKMSCDWSLLPLRNRCLLISSLFTSPHITKMVKVSSASLQSATITPLSQGSVV